MSEESTYNLISNTELISIEFKRYINGEIWIYSISASLDDLLNSETMAAKSKLAYESFSKRPSTCIDHE